MVSSFADLGKPARDLFDKHFTFGFLNFEFKTKTENDISITCAGKHDVAASRITGSLESKLKAVHGISLKTKVDSKWVVTNELEVEKKIHKGLSHNLITTMETESGVKTLLLKNKFKHDHLNAILDMNFKSRYPLLTGSLVVPIPNYPEFSLGAQAILDTQSSKLSKHVYAANYKQNDLQVHAALTDHSNVDLSVYQKHKNMKLGFRVGWRNEVRESSFGAALSYKPSSNKKMRLKIDQNCIIGMAYKIKLNSDASLILCTQFDGKNLENAGQKYGLTFKFG